MFWGFIWTLLLNIWVNNLAKKIWSYNIKISLRIQITIFCQYSKKNYEKWSSNLLFMSILSHFYGDQTSKHSNFRVWSLKLLIFFQIWEHENILWCHCNRDTDITMKHLLLLLFSLGKGETIFIFTQIYTFYCYRD